MRRDSGFENREVEAENQEGKDSVILIIVERYHNISPFMAPIDIPVGGDDLVQRIGPVNDRL